MIVVSVIVMSVLGLLLMVPPIVAVIASLPASHGNKEIEKLSYWSTHFVSMHPFPCVHIHHLWSAYTENISSSLVIFVDGQAKHRWILVNGHKALQQTLICSSLFSLLCALMSLDPVSCELGHYSITITNNNNNNKKEKRKNTCNWHYMSFTQTYNTKGG